MRFSCRAQHEMQNKALIRCLVDRAKELKEFLAPTARLALAYNKSGRNFARSNERCRAVSLLIAHHVIGVTQLLMIERQHLALLIDLKCQCAEWWIHVECRRQRPTSFRTLDLRRDLRSSQEIA